MANTIHAGRVQITARIDRGLHRRLRIAAATEGRPRAGIIADALAAYLSGGENR